MKKLISGVAAVAMVTAVTPGRASDLETAYWLLLNDYGRLMVYAEACELSTRFGLKYDVLQALTGKVDIMKVEMDLDQAFALESDRSGKVACDPEITKGNADSYGRGLDNLVAVLDNGGKYPEPEPTPQPAPAPKPAPKPVTAKAQKSSVPKDVKLVGKQIGYGSRAGMTVTVSAASGLDTADAVIEANITKNDATGYCRDYIGKLTDECIEKQMHEQLSPSITANCDTGVFTDFGGYSYQFIGPMNPSHDPMAPEYAIIDLNTRQVADGSSASGYYTNLEILNALCPDKGLTTE